MPPIAPNAACPCGSGKKYKKCCRVYHKGVAPPTPEALMRSRYTAYVVDDMDYIMDTTHPDSTWFRADRAAWRAELARITANRRYTGLTVLAADGSTVTFHAGIIRNNGEDISFTERSQFAKHDGRWLYVDGEVQPHQP